MTDAEADELLDLVVDLVTQACLYERNGELWLSDHALSTYRAAFRFLGITKDAVPYAEAQEMIWQRWPQLRPAQEA